MTGRERNQSRKGTKRALTGSILAIVLCVVLLAGATFAWFTDTASTKVNDIKAGTLKIALEVKENGNWVDATGKTINFVKASGHEDEDILWEPGAQYELPEMRIVNKGNLALKYKVEIVGIDGDAKLNDAIDWYYSIDLASTALGGTGWTEPTDAYKLDQFGEEDYLLPNGETANIRTDEKVFKIVGKMQKTAGNEYQGLTIEGVKLNVLATQYTYEYDSNGNQYDKDAEYAETVMSTADFKTALASANGVYDGQGAMVVLKESERAYQNNKTAQFYLGSDNVNINSSLETVDVRNVTFIYDDDDENSDYTNGELQVTAKNISFSGCTFINVSVSPWETKSGADDCANATFNNCTWKNLNGRYGVHQSLAKNLVVTDCTFENCERGIHTNAKNPASVTITDNVFAGLGDDYGMLCLAENGSYAAAELNISGNDAAGQTCLRQLNSTVTKAQVDAIFANNTFATQYVTGSTQPTA